MVFCFLFFQQEKEGPAGVWGRGLSRPQRRDLQGSIDHIPMKPAASNIPPARAGRKIPAPGPARSDKKYKEEFCCQDLF